MIVFIDLKVQQKVKFACTLTRLSACNFQLIMDIQEV